jgi:hypothetical protein
MKKVLQRSLIIATLTILSNNYCNAQWMSLGPYGGNVTCLFSYGTTIYAGTDLDGLFRSKDSGTTWSRYDNGVMAGNSTLSVAIKGDTVFAISYGRVWQSGDDGKSWTDVDSGLGVNGGQVLLAAGGNVVLGENGGLYISTNNGQTWVPKASVSGGVNSLLSVNQSILAGTVKGVYRSSDNGVTWSSSGLATAHILSLASSGNYVLAATSAALYISPDGGSSWNAVNSGPTSGTVNAVGASGTSMFAGTATGGIYRSLDEGATWQMLSSGLTSATITCFDNVGNAFFVGTGDNGVFRSDDNGTTWTSTSHGLPSLSTSSVAILGSNVFVVNPSRGYHSTDGGSTWQLPSIDTIPSSHGIFALNSQNVYAAGTSIYESSDAGSTWKSLYADTSKSPFTALVFGTNFVFALRGSTVLRSSNGGASWTIIDNGISNLNVKSLALFDSILLLGTSTGLYRSGDNGTTWTSEYIGLITLVSTFTAHNGNIFAGTANGVYKSSDHGNTWYSTGLTNIHVNALTASDTLVFAGTTGTHFLYCSTNDGGTWIAIDAGIAGERITNSLAIAGGSIYAATQATGVWKSPLSAFGNSTVETSLTLSNSLTLDQNYPNPTSAQTTFSFSLKDASAASLTISDAVGREYRVLDHAWISAGKHSITWNAHILPSGVYSYTLACGMESVTKHFIVSR